MEGSKPLSNIVRLALTTQIKGSLPFSRPLLPICYLTDNLDGSRALLIISLLRKDRKHKLRDSAALPAPKAQETAPPTGPCHSSVTMKTLK